MVSNIRVLVTSIGRRGQLIRWLKGEVGEDGRVLGADASYAAPAAYLADEWFHVPPVGTSNYIEVLVDICRRQRCGLLIPTIDPELSFLADAAQLFEQVGTTVLISDPRTISIASNKVRSSAWLHERGFPTPDQQLVPKNAPWPEDLRFPIFVKPASGSRSVDARRINSRRDMPSLPPGEDMVVEEFIDGREFTVSVYVNRMGRCMAAIPRERVEVREGEVSKAVTRRVPALEQLAVSITEQLPGAWGPLNIQVIQERETARLAVLEINARFGGGDPLAWHAGANAPAWAIAEVLGQELPPKCDWVPDLAMLRFDDAVVLPWPH